MKVSQVYHSPRARGGRATLQRNVDASWFRPLLCWMHDFERTCTNPQAALLTTAFEVEKKRPSPQLAPRLGGVAAGSAN